MSIQSQTDIFDSGLEEATEMWKEYTKNQWNSPPAPIEFVNPKLDFKLDPQHFMDWLELENQEVWGDYRTDCASMCEYSCLYVSMLLHKKKLKGELKIISGSFGFWEHYWLQYTYKGVQYFIDLTLQQFVKDSPKCAISLGTPEVDNGYRNFYYIEVEEYLQNKRAFEFYTNPHII